MTQEYQGGIIDLVNRRHYCGKALVRLYIIYKNIDLPCLFILLRN